MLTIYFDSIQEGNWFKGLHPALSDALLAPFPPNREIERHHLQLKNALSFDRPDIILCEDGVPILVVERTIEVPSGHNVGQRFARLVAAAKHQIPVVYFGPYVAFKHGGVTQGPRYMNLRLFYALDSMAQTYKTSITTINWIVDSDYEIIRDDRKDERMIAYLKLFFDLYGKTSFDNLRSEIIHSKFEKVQHEERQEFISREIQNPEQYSGPPASVSFVNYSTLISTRPALRKKNIKNQESLIYNVGMRYVRSDPYTGMSLLYTYLYCGSLEARSRNMILHFPNIEEEQWRNAAANNNRKDVRLYKMVSDAIIFSDTVLQHSEL